jgi:ribonuclease E
MVGTWQRDQRRAGVAVLLQALAEKRIGRRDQAQAWVWRLAEYTRDCHEEYAVARWPETKRLLGLFVNSSGRAHGKNARRLVQAARGQDRRLAVALLAAAVAHTPEAEEVLRGARMRMARKPSAVARELLRNLPKGGKKRRRRKRAKDDGDSGRNGRGDAGAGSQVDSENDEALDLEDEDEDDEDSTDDREGSERARSGGNGNSSRRRTRRGARRRSGSRSGNGGPKAEAEGADEGEPDQDPVDSPTADED